MADAAVPAGTGAAVSLLDRAVKALYGPQATPAAIIAAAENPFKTFDLVVAQMVRLWLDDQDRLIGEPNDVLWMPEDE